MNTARAEQLKIRRDALVAAGAPAAEVEALDAALSEAEGQSLLGDGAPRPAAQPPADAVRSQP